jgi:hypothetical protein
LQLSGQTTKQFNKEFLHIIVTWSPTEPARVARFFLVQDTKTEKLHQKYKINQMATKSTKWP